MVEITIDHTLLPPFQPIKAIDLQYGENYVLDVAANSQYAVASASDSLIRLYDLGSLELAHTLRLQKGGISKIKLYNDQYLFSSSADGSLCRWDLRMCAPAQVFKYSRELSTFDINCNDTMAVLGTNCDMASQELPELAFFDTRQTSPIAVFNESHNDDVTDIHCHPTEPMSMLSCSTDGIVNNYNLEDFDEMEALVSVVNAGSAVQKASYFGPDCSYVYALTYTETFGLYTLEGDPLCDYGDVRDIDGVDYAIDCSYNPNEHRLYLLTGNNEGAIQIFHVNIGALQHCQTLQAPGGHSDTIRSLYWNHQTQSILTGGEDGRMCAWQGVSS